MAGIVLMLSRHVEKHTIIGAVPIPDQASAHLIPAAHCPKPRYAGVISGPEPHLALPHAISNRLAAVLGKGCRVKHAVAFQKRTSSPTIRARPAKDQGPKMTRKPCGPSMCVLSRSSQTKEDCLPSYAAPRTKARPRPH
jgi:hypothetical protein